MSTVEKSDATPVDTTINNSDVVTKYSKAADIANRALAKVIEACVVDAKLIDVCKLGDEFITNELKGVYTKGKIHKSIAFPTTITPNNLVCHLNPLATDAEANIVIAGGDVLKIVLGAQIDGFSAMTGHTLVVGASEANPVTGAKADVITATYMAGEAVLRMMTPGRSNKEITETIDKIADAYKVKAVEGMMSYQQEQNQVDGEKSIMLNPNEQQRRDYKEQTLEAGEVYCIDMIMSTGDGKARPSELRTTIYKKTDSNYQLKVAASRVLVSEVKQKFGNFPFTLRALDDSNKARLAIAECTKTSVIYPYPIFTEKSGDIVAQVQYTVFVTANGPVRITTSPALDTSVIQSEHKIEDETINTLLAQTLAKKKKNKNKKRSGGKSTATA